MQHIRTYAATLLVVCLAPCLAALPAKAQLLASPAPILAPGPRPIPLSHYYWYFLRHQKTLDDFAARRAAEGKDGNQFRNDLQTRLGFTDAEYAPIRIASGRLSAEVVTLNGKAREVQKGEPIPTVREDELKQLVAEREQDIQAEVTFLKQSLPPERIATLEAFAVQFFAPKKASNNSLQSPTKETP